MRQEEKNSLDFWNANHKSREVDRREDILTDNWIQEFEQWIEPYTTVLDLGCGGGNDIRIFVEKGKRVTACDQSDTAIHQVKRIFPELEAAVCFRMPGVFPFGDNCFDVICADLSLHYFTKQDTLAVLGELKRILAPSGYLLIRVNSINDINHGAGMGEEVEEHLFKTDDGMLKRFFDEKDARSFFSDFDILFCEEQDMSRYKALKKVYTICAKNNQ